MPSAVEHRVEPELEDLVRQTEGDDAPAHREDVGVVVLARQAGGVEIVAERGADTGNFVRRHLLALPGAAKHNAAIGASVGYRARDVDADRRIVDRVFAGRAVIVDRVAEPLQRLLQMFFEDEAGVIGADRDAHQGELYYTLAISAFSCQLSAFSDVLIRARIGAALAFRETLAIDATAYRLVHGEADLLPSLIVDRYGDYLVVQTLSQGMDRLLPIVVAALADLVQPRGILARNDPR